MPPVITARMRVTDTLAPAMVAGGMVLNVIEANGSGNDADVAAAMYATPPTKVRT